MERIGILYHPINKATYPLAQELKGFLSARGVSAWLCSAWEKEEAECQLDTTDLILTVGGDGTILRAAQVVAAHSVPITGINLGRLGFMTELGVDEAKDRLPALLAGEGWIDERAMLEAELLPPGKEAASVFHALNDVVLARGEVARMVRVKASVDEVPLTTYKADGVILATATGSTGYSLSAGGPILHPQAEDFLLLPILPHLSSDYTLVLPATVVVKLHLSVTHQATLSIDGHINLPVSDGATLSVKRSAHKTRFLRVHPETSFYGSLERKLRGKR
ncbi:MAG: NAD(+)/NADH kinase [Dehalococcoidia bacterium]